MSAAIAFDTHRFVKNLTANGFTEAQAEALAYEQIHLFEANLATKSDIAAVKGDIAAVKGDLEVKIAEVKADLELKIEQVKSSLLKWMAGALTAHLAVVVAMIQFLVRTA